MEQDTAELHLGRIRDVKDLTGLGDEARDVVKEEVILESPNHQLDTKVRMVTSNENSGGSGGVVSVPVSLPIGSMITGTAYNVITPDQIPHFKQMLCVDNNGYISSGTLVGNMGGDLKTIVIQQQQQQQQTTTGAAGNGATAAVGTNHDGSGSNDSAETGEHPSQGGGSGCGSGSGGVGGGAGSGGSGVAWTDISHNEVFPIRCKTTCAELYRSKLGSGGRGRCVKYKDKWYTPSEFENVCGRGSSKDWKRSIKYAGKSLQSLIDDNVLTPHATNCSCTVCCDDEAASGPVRLFTPYKRRKRNQTDLDGDVGLGGGIGGGGGGGSGGSVVGMATGATKRKRNKSLNNNTDPQPTQATSVVDEQNMFLTEDQITTKDEPWPTLNDSLDTSTDLVDQSQIGGHYDRDTYVVNINDAGSLALLDNSQTMKNLESVYSTMVRATNDFKRIMTDLKNSYDRKIELLQKERDAAVEAVRVQVHTDVDDPNISGSLHGNEMISAKKCANCNREALAECSLCRKTPYCSEFCQRKDWNAHQVECTRNPVQSTQQIMLLVDDQS